MHITSGFAAATVAVLTAASAAHAEPASAITLVPGQGDSVVSESSTSSLLSSKPRSAMMWESVEPAAASNEVNSHVIYLHRCVGSDCTVAQGSTNSTTNPVRSSLGHGVLSAFTQSDDTWNQVVSCMKDVYAPFNVEVTTDSPGSAPHFEILFGGKPQEIGLSAGIGGVSPFSCVPYIPNSVVFVFDVWGSDVEELCATAAQEIAHSFSLDHSTEPSDPMTYYPYKGRRFYANQQIQCGSDCDKDHRSPLGASCTGDTYQNHVCACGNGSQTQNSYQTISTLFGGGSGDPPIVKILSPKIGDFVTDNFPVSFEATADNSITKSELRVDGTLINTITSGTSFTGPAGLADGTHQVEVTAYTAMGASSRSRVDVVVGAGCKADDGCGTGQACIGGRCVAGPEVSGGLGTSCAAAADCASLQCANSDGAKYCVEACQPGQCPSGFGCRADGAGGGVCWPGYDDSSGGCAVSTAGSSSLPIGGALFGLAVLFAVTRRRRGEGAQA